MACRSKARYTLCGDCFLRLWDCGAAVRQSLHNDLQERFALSYWPVFICVMACLPYGLWGAKIKNPVKKCELELAGRPLEKIILAATIEFLQLPPKIGRP